MKFRVALFGTLGLLALLFLAIQASNLGAWDRPRAYRLTARFDDIGNLKLRAPVRSAGVTVGRVTSIEFDAHRFQAKVVMELDSTFRLPVDSSAKILTAGLLGDQYVGLDPGSDGRFLANGEAIRQTQSAIVLENLIGQLMGATNKHAPKPAHGVSASKKATAPSSPLRR